MTDSTRQSRRSLLSPPPVFEARRPRSRPEASPRRAPAASVPLPGETVVTLLFTNDLHGRVHLPGQAQGLAALAPLVRAVRAQMPHVLLLDAGDIIHGTPMERVEGPVPVLDALNALGYDAATVGNHEFDWGQDVLRRAIGHARFPLLSANVVAADTGAPWGGLRPYIVREIGGVRVAIFGLTTPTTVNIEWPRTLLASVSTTLLPSRACLCRASDVRSGPT
jgi:2',3'-cyclic-nucleotide 2'-phosphodiesterase (5'-nucleotidase family)